MPFHTKMFEAESRVNETAAGQVQSGIGSALSTDKPAVESGIGTALHTEVPAPTHHLDTLTHERKVGGGHEHYAGEHKK